MLISLFALFVRWSVCLVVFLVSCLVVCLVGWGLGLLLVCLLVCVFVFLCSLYVSMSDLCATVTVLVVLLGAPHPGLHFGAMPHTYVVHSDGCLLCLWAFFGSASLSLWVSQTPA